MIYFVFNKVSGTYTAEREDIIRSGSKKLFAHNFNIRYTKLSNDTYVPDIDPGAIRSDDIIVAVGGDGTINLCLQFIHDNELSKKVLLGFIPAGTGNNMVKISNLSKSVSRSLDIIKNKEIKELQYGTINDKKVFFNFSLGFSTFVLQNRSTSSLVGYALDGIKNYFKFKSKKVKITLENEMIENKLFAAFFINTTHYMSFIRFRKDNNMSNNINLFYLIDDNKLIIFFKLFSLLLGINFFTTTTSAHLTVEMSNGHKVEVDGDIYETNEKLLRINNDFKINFISG